MARRRFRIFRRKDRKGVWGDIVLPDGRRKRLPLAKTKKIARAAARTMEDRLARGEPLEERDSMTFADFVKEVYEVAKQCLRSWEISEKRRTRSLVKFFGRYPLASIDRPLIERYKEARRLVRTRSGRPVKNATVNRDLCRLKNILYHATNLGWLASNPMSRFPIGGKRGLPEEGRIRFLHPHEFAEIAKHLPPPVRRIAELAVHTGMRRGEILALRWGDIDLKALRITVRLDKDAACRLVPINQPVARLLAAMPRGNASDLVFTWEDGRPIKDFRGSFEKAVEMAGVQDLHFHDLRHTAITWMQAEGTPPKTVAEIVGHRTLVMVMRYSHVTDKMKDEAVRRLGERLTGSNCEGRVQPERIKSDAGIERMEA